MKKTVKQLRPHILDIVESHGFVVFENEDYNLNLIGVRKPIGVAKENSFDDVMHVVFKKFGQWEHKQYKITTEPGKYWLLNGRTSGTAVLCSPQQVRGGWKLGLHKGQYKALCQVKKVNVWRDSDRDEVAEESEIIDNGYFGINIHRSNPTKESIYVGRWSAGCQVFADPNEYNEFIEICEKQKELRGWDTFTYTIITGNY